jgi:hypothetical protein
MSTLQETRVTDGATLIDDNGRFYALERDGKRVYGYSAWMSGAYVCYTCGHLCDCGEGEGE